MGVTLTFRTVLVLGGLSVLTACSGDGPLGFKLPFGGGEKAATSTTLVERDVEAPEVFQASDNGLWDGRPSLGGIWVAHPDVSDPERAIVRNEDNGKFVIGALFRRESDNPGPTIQVSSEAAEALGMLAGQPASLNVTALRKAEAPAEPETDPVLNAPEDIAATSLDDADVIPAAATIAATPAPTAPAASPAPAATAASSTLSKPFIQVALFRDESNANNAAAGLRSVGAIPVVRRGVSNKKTTWRVLVGPAPTSDDRAAMLSKIKALGYSDAYFVSG
ncbi:MAG: SPOR domain-containing protein [Rhodobacteraceae bacterium]|nr:SPOR domain-containing protein [Paracoccaceae bacterium]